MINCRTCKAYYVTWRKKHPHGCRTMGFMSFEFPSSFVRRASGTPCLLYEPKDMRRNLFLRRRQLVNDCQATTIGHMNNK